MMDGGLLNFMVGEYLKAIGSEVAQEFQELTKAAAPLPDSLGLGEMVQQFDTKTPKLEMPKEEVDKTPKLEIPEPEEEEADNPSPERRACLLACKRLPVDPTSKHPVQLLNEVFRGSEITWHINGTWVSNLYI